MMSANVAAPAIPAEDLLDLQRSDDNLRREAARGHIGANHLGLEGLVGGLQAVIINTEPDLQKPAALELIRYSGLEFQEAFVDSMHRTCVLKVPDSREFHSADFLIRAQDRDGAILEFMNLTNYNFDFAIYVKSLNSITSVARFSRSDFAMVFTSWRSNHICEPTPLYPILSIITC
jgi:hypothetical protein